MKYYYSAELNHHGILGQKWGRRNGPPYPLGERDHSRQEVKDGWKKSLGSGRNEHLYDRNDSGQEAKNDEQSKKASKVDRYLKTKFKLTDEQVSKYKKTAAILGVSLAATAGVLAVSYAINKSKIPADTLNANASSILSNDNAMNLGRDIVQTHSTQGYDASALYGRSSTTVVDKINNTILVGDPVGRRARLNGYDTVRDGYSLLHSAIPITNDRTLAEDCIVSQRSAGKVLDRRLSCWSGSHSYLLSKLTGKQYCSRNYQNLVEFNSFGSLYNRKMDIIDIFGNKANDFVGSFGKDNGSKIHGSLDAKKMINSIYDTFNKPNAADGSIVGFIDAAYRNTTCTHQWNFEISKSGIMSMVDTWSGEKYSVASRNTNGQIKYDSNNFEKLLSEMYHYNRESFRMYSPSLDDLNLDKISQIVLARTKDI